MRNIIRWGLTLCILSIASIYLYSAAYAAWIFFGPPEGMPEEFLQRSIFHSSFGISFLFVAIFVFIFLRDKSISSSKIIIFVTSLQIAALILAIGFACYPYLWEFMEIDACLDSGGSWNYEVSKCEIY